MNAILAAANNNNNNNNNNIIDIIIVGSLISLGTMQNIIDIIMFISQSTLSASLCH